MAKEVILTGVKSKAELTKNWKISLGIFGGIFWFSITGLLLFIFGLFIADHYSVDKNSEDNFGTGFILAYFVLVPILFAIFSSLIINVVLFTRTIIKFEPKGKWNLFVKITATMCYIVIGLAVCTAIAAYVSYLHTPKY